MPNAVIYFFKWYKCLLRHKQNKQLLSYVVLPKLTQTRNLRIGFLLRKKQTNKQKLCSFQSVRSIAVMSITGNKKPNQALCPSQKQTMSVESVMPSNILVLCFHFSSPRPQSFSIETLWLGSFIEWPYFPFRLSASVASVNIRDWSPLG